MDMLAELLKVGAAFLGGYGTLWLRTKKMREEYEHFKRQRRLTGAKADERLHRAAKMTEILVSLAKHDIPHERLFELMPLVLEGKTNLDPQEDDESVVLEFPHSAEEISVMISILWRESIYWQLLEELQACDAGTQKFTPEQQKQLGLMKQELEEDLPPDTLNGDENKRNITRGFFLGLLWITGATVASSGDDPGINFESLLGDLQSQKADRI